MELFFFSCSLGILFNSLGKTISPDFGVFFLLFPFARMKNRTQSHHQRFYMR